MSKGEEKIVELWIVVGRAGCRGAYDFFEPDTEKRVHWVGGGGSAEEVNDNVWDPGDKEYGVNIPLDSARAGGAGADSLLSMKEGLGLGIEEAEEDDDEKEDGFLLGSAFRVNPDQSGNWNAWAKVTGGTDLAAHTNCFKWMNCGFER